MALLSDLKHSKQILEACVEINRLENEADTLSREAVAARTLRAEKADRTKVEFFTLVRGEDQ